MADLIKHEIDDLEVIAVLDKLESDTVRDTGVHRISGGFARAEAKSYDDDVISVELKWGICSDCEDVVHTEQYYLDRVTLKWRK